MCVKRAQLYLPPPRVWKILHLKSLHRGVVRQLAADSIITYINNNTVINIVVQVSLIVCGKDCSSASAS